MSTRWRDIRRGAHHRGVHHSPRRVLVATLALGALGLGLVACGGGDTQGRREPDPSEIESQVAQLRLEVQTLRRQVQSLQATVGTTIPAEPTPSGATAAVTTPPTSGG
jgi:hypothetical protein